MIEFYSEHSSQIRYSRSSGFIMMLRINGNWILLTCFKRQNLAFSYLFIKGGVCMKNHFIRLLSQ